MQAGDVATGRDDAALATSDNNRFVLEFRIVAFFDRREKSVAINMRDGESFKVWMRDDPE